MRSLGRVLWIGLGFLPVIFFAAVVLGGVLHWIGGK